MKTIYSLPYCPGCTVVKQQLRARGEPFKEVMINRDITLDEFNALYPDVKSVPYIVEDADDQS
jgi:glutaredoxin